MKTKLLFLMLLVPLLSYGQLSSPIKTDGNEQPVMQTTTGATNGATWICTNQATGQGKWSSPVGFHAYLTSTFNFTNGTVRTVSYTTETYDYGNNWDGTTFTAPVKGEYFIIVHAYWEGVVSPLSPACELTIVPSGLANLVNRGVVASGRVDGRVETSGLVRLNAGGTFTVTILGQIPSTNSLWNADGDNNITCWLIRELP